MPKESLRKKGKWIISQVKKWNESTDDDLLTSTCIFSVFGLRQIEQQNGQVLYPVIDCTKELSVSPNAYSCSGER